MKHRQVYAIWGFTVGPWHGSRGLHGAGARLVLPLVHLTHPRKADRRLPPRPAIRASRAGCLTVAAAAEVAPIHTCGLALGLRIATGAAKPAWAWPPSALANRAGLTTPRLSCGFEALPYARLVRGGTSLLAVRRERTGTGCWYAASERDPIDVRLLIGLAFGPSACTVWYMYRLVQAFYEIFTRA